MDGALYLVDLHEVLQLNTCELNMPMIYSQFHNAVQSTC